MNNHSLYPKILRSVFKCVLSRDLVQFSGVNPINMVNRKIPDRWEMYAPVGAQVSGTKFLPFKVPLKMQLVCSRIPEEEWFTPEIVIERTPALKAVIDLTATDRYYNPKEFTTRGVRHKKISIQGGGQVPTDQNCSTFFKAVDEFLKDFDDDEDALIGVHCTHGLNRTGYLICKYMVARMKIDPNEAIRRFEDARGYVMERPAYVKNIKKASCDRTSRSSSSSTSQTSQSSHRPNKKSARDVNWRDEPRSEPGGNKKKYPVYQSPLQGYDDDYDDVKSRRYNKCPRR